MSAARSGGARRNDAAATNAEGRRRRNESSTAIWTEQRREGRIEIERGTSQTNRRRSADQALFRPDRFGRDFRDASCCSDKARQRVWSLIETIHSSSRRFVFGLKRDFSPSPFLPTFYQMRPPVSTGSLSLISVDLRYMVLRAPPGRVRDRFQEPGRVSSYVGCMDLFFDSLA